LAARLWAGVFLGWFLIVPPSLGQEASPVQKESGAAKSREFPERLAVGTDLMTKYVARGVAYSTGPVIKPWMTLDHLSYYVELKGVYDVDLEKLNEIDVTVDHTWSIRSWRAALGYNLYLFPNTNYAEMHEGYLRIVAPIFLRPMSELYYGRWAGEDSFLMKLTVGHTVQFERCSLALSAITVYRDDESFRGTEFRVTVPIPMEEFVLRPTIRYSWSVKDEIADELYGGLILEYAF